MWVLVWVTFGLPVKYERPPMNVFFFEHRQKCEEQRRGMEAMVGNTVKIEVEDDPPVRSVKVRNKFACVPAYNGERPGESP